MVIWLVGLLSVWWSLESAALHGQMASWLVWPLALRMFESAAWSDGLLAGLAFCDEDV